MIYCDLDGNNSFFFILEILFKSDSPLILPAAFSLTQDIHGVRFSPYSSIANEEANLDCYASYFDQNHIEAPLNADLNLTVAQKQKFTINEVSPEWGYATEATKVCAIQLCNVIQ